MASLNKIFLMGNLTRDPELRYTQNGKALASFGIAVSRNWTSPEGEKKEDVCFVDVSMFGKRAEIISEYFSKGSPIFIEAVGDPRRPKAQCPERSGRGLSVYWTD